MNYLIDTHAVIWFITNDNTLLIAQAIFEKLTIVSKDQFFDKYDVSLIW